MKPPKSSKHLLFGDAFLLANRLQFVGDRMVPGLSTKQWFLLRNLMEMPESPPPTITQVASAMDSTRQNTAKMLESMERQGLVAITPSDSDHRGRDVRLTPEGLAQAKRSAKEGQQFLNRIFKGIPLQEREIAGKVLMQMLENLEQMKEALPE